MEVVETAYHEAGHAVAFYSLGFDVEAASIVPDASSRGHVSTPFSDHFLHRVDVLEYMGEDGREFARRQLVASVSGVKAVELLTGCDYDPRSDDLDTRHAGTDWFTFNVWLPKLGAPSQYDEIYSDAWEEADRVLRKEWSAVTAVAEALLERDELDAAALRTVLEETGCSRDDAPIRRVLLGFERDRLSERVSDLMDEGDSDQEIKDLQQRLMRIDEELETLEAGQEEEA